MNRPVRNVSAQSVDPPVGDDQLVERVALGELEALGLLFDRHERALRVYVTRLGLGRGDADDIVQTVFLEVVRSATRFDKRWPAKNWLFGIATMLVRRRRRSVVRQAARLLRLSHQSLDVSPQSPEDCYRGDQAAERFQTAFQKLSAKKKEVFALVVMEGMSGEQAATTLGIPVNTVWTRLHHARAELRWAVGGEAS
jgi:RNA polymerase sigma-70 factor (ECF subfamily)